MKFLNTIYWIFLGLLFFNLLPISAEAQITPNVLVNLNAKEVAPDSFVEVRVLVSSEKKVNAFDIELEYSPELFSFERSYTERSVVSIWKSLPINDEEGNISLIGGSVNPWSGSSNEIITLVFKARRSGSSSFSIKKAELALADGLGTKVLALSASREIDVYEGANLVNSEIPSTSPKIAGAFFVDDPATKEPVVIVETTDAGSIKWLGIRSRSWIFWSDWQKTQFTSSIPKYSWTTQLKAISFNGEETSTTLYRWEIVVVKLVSIIILLVLMVLLLRLFKKRRADAELRLSGLLFFILLGTFLFVSPASAATLSISPGGGAFNVGGTFDVQIVLNTEGESVNALDIRLMFPPNILQVVSPTAGQSIVDIWTSPPRFDNQKGEIILQGGIPKGINVSRGLISTVTFRARQTGSANLRFSDNTKVLLHDGKGTDVLTNALSAIYQFVLPPPAGPIVASETHPDQTLWYANPNVLLRFKNTALVSGYSFVLNDLPVFTPDNTVNDTESFVSYQNLESGVHYFHIKALGAGGAWGGTTHFAVNIDAEPPARFPVEVRPSSRTTSKTLFLYFNTTDRYSGVERYEYSLVPLNPSNLKQAEAYSQFFVEAQSPEIIELGVGKYDVISRAYDKAGNFQESTERVRVMTPFVFFATSKWTLAIGFLLILILAVTYRKIYHWYRELEQRHARKDLPRDLKKQMEELKGYRNKYGALVLAIGFLAGMFWFSNSVLAENLPGSLEEQIAKLPPPLITTVSKNISNEDIFYIGGKTESGVIDVNIFLQNLRTGETRSFMVTSDQNGDWFYRHPTFLSTGEYLLWTQSNLGELASPPSPQAGINVSRTAIQFGSNRLSFETLYLALAILLLLAIVGLIAFIAFIFSKGRKKHVDLMREVKEAEESVRRGFAVLKRDIEAELTLIHKIKLRKEISEEERQKEKQLMSDLSEMERYIGKEIWDIEKYA